MVLRSDLMNSEVSALFLNRVLLAYPGKPILLLWDRATWHRGKSVKAVLEAHPRLEVFCFAPCSPELNPQEPVWKATREAVSPNHTQAKLLELANSFEKHLTATRFPCSLLQQHGYHEIRAMFK